MHTFMLCSEADPNWLTCTKCSRQPQFIGSGSSLVECGVLGSAEAGIKSRWLLNIFTDSDQAVLHVSSVFSLEATTYIIQ